MSSQAGLLHTTHATNTRDVTNTRGARDTSGVSAVSGVDELHGADADAMLMPLLGDIEQRLVALGGGDDYLLDLLRRRLIAKLSCSERRAAAKRRAIHAKKFVAQRGRCATCGLTLSGTCVRRGRVLPTDKPLRCAACDKDGETRGG